MADSSIETINPAEGLSGILSGFFGIIAGLATVPADVLFSASKSFDEMFGVSTPTT